MDDNKLRNLIEDDDLGLLKIKPKQSDVISEGERLVESFYEIAAYYEQHGREPENNLANVQEARLAMRLEGLRNNPEKIRSLIDLDDYGLLVPVNKPKTIDDVLDDDDLNLLGDSVDDSIFILRNVPQNIDSPDYVAQRKPCKDFDQFDSLFKQCHVELKSGKRKLLAFANEQQIKKHQFFVLRGVMAYVADVGKKERKGGKVNARLRCIFENGTESDMLLRSLSCELYKDGRRISEHEDHLMDDLKHITDEDAQSGYIYILQSLSSNPDISSIRDLYKIGFSTVPVDERVTNAEDDPTFLMSQVRIVEEFECYNLNPQKLEMLLHQFFGKVCLELDVFDKAGKRHTPREWFIAPLPVIEEAISLIISGEIINYNYDDEIKMISARETNGELTR